MPQGPLPIAVAKPAGGSYGPMTLGRVGELLTSAGGETVAFNNTAAAVIAARPGRLAKLIVIAPGTTSGAFTLNDCLTTGAAAASNELWSIAYNATANVGGAIFALDLPFATGLVLSAVPGGGSPIVVISYI
jgi:hypothetical protein